MSPTSRAEQLTGGLLTGKAPAVQLLGRNAAGGGGGKGTAGGSAQTGKATTGGDAYHHFSDPFTEAIANSPLYDPIIGFFQWANGSPSHEAAPAGATITLGGGGAVAPQTTPQTLPPQAPALQDAGSDPGDKGASDDYQGDEQPSFASRLARGAMVVVDQLIRGVAIGVLVLAAVAAVAIAVEAAGLGAAAVGAVWVVAAVAGIFLAGYAIGYFLAGPRSDDELALLLGMWGRCSWWEGPPRALFRASMRQRPANRRAPAGSPAVRAVRRMSCPPFRAAPPQSPAPSHQAPAGKEHPARRRLARATPSR